MKMQRLSSIVAAAAVLCVAGSASAQSIFNNPITGTNPNTANPYTTGQTVNANITVSGIGRGTGITGTNANNRYNANGWNSPTLNTADFFNFTLTPNAGFEIDFTNFVYVGEASGTGATSFAFRSSLDGFTSNIGTPTATGTTISLGAGTYQNINTSVEFRLYGWGASSGTGTFSVNDFTFNGTVSSSNAAPIFGAGSYTFAGAPGQAFSIPVSVTDTNAGDTLTLSTGVLNAGLSAGSFSTTSGTSPLNSNFIGTIASGATIGSTFTQVISVSDGNGGTANVNVNFTVIPEPMVIAVTGLIGSYVGLRRRRVIA
jgi:hypothetical protein